MNETHRRVLNMITRGRLEASTDTDGLQTHQVSLYAKETKSNVERMQQYGITTNPMPGSEVLVVFPNGNREHGVIVAIENRASRLPRMAPGEVSLYSDEGDVVSLRRGNCVQIVTHTLDVGAATQAVIKTPVVKVTADQSVSVQSPQVGIEALVTIKGDLVLQGGGGTERSGAGSITATGPVTLAGNAASALQAVPLQQLQAAISGGGAPGAGLAPLNSPAFIGTPTAPTPAAGNVSTLLSTTAFVSAAVQAAQTLPGNGLSKTVNTLNVVGTANRIAVAAAVDIAATYIGQSSITTLGTIASGVWSATIISVAKGGTGVGTLTGYVKGAGTAALTAVAQIPNADVAGLGSMALQAASAVAITGGTINNVTLDSVPATALATKAYVDAQIAALQALVGASQWDGPVAFTSTDEGTPE